MTITFGKKVVRKDYDLTTSFKFNSNVEISPSNLDNKSFVFLQSGNDKILDSIMQYLSNINLNFVYFIAVDFSSEIKLSDIEAILPKTQIVLLFVPNYGMDVGKFFYQIHFLKTHNIANINDSLKLHTKSDRGIRTKILATLIKSNERLMITSEILKQKTIVGCKELFWTSTNPEYEKTMCRNNVKNTQYIMKKYFDKQYSPEIHNSFFEGTMFWFTNRVFQDLYALDISDVYKEFSYGRVSNDQLIEHAWERVFCFIQHDALFAIGENLIKSHKINLSAIYFPQFHFNEENDTLWGKNFTEWTLLKPNYQEHKLDIPHADIGFYNITSRHTRQHQSNIAKEFGITSFMIYHYWFKDRAVLNTPLELLLNDGEPNIEFFFSWANEPWTRNWDGLEKEILIDQSFDGVYNMKKHFDYLLRFFRHKNYKKINNKPVFVIYRTDIMKEHINTFLEYFNKSAKTKGFAGMHFIFTVGNFNINYDTINMRLVKGTFTFLPNYLAQVENKKYKKNGNFNYKTLVDFSQPESIERTVPNHSSVFTSWNNTVRRLKNKKLATVFDDSSPDLFYEMLLHTLVDALLRSTNIEETFIFINAWNEWNEQAMLEPSINHGYEYIKQIQKLYFV